MRVLIDLQDCQRIYNKKISPDNPFIACLKGFAKFAPAHEIHVLLNNEFPNSIEPISCAIDSLIAKQHIHVCQLSLTRQSNWSTAANALLLQSYIQPIKPDVVFFSNITLDLLTAIPSELAIRRHWLTAALFPKRRFRRTRHCQLPIDLLLIPATGNLFSRNSKKHDGTVVIRPPKSSADPWSVATNQCLAALTDLSQKSLSPTTSIHHSNTGKESLALVLPNVSNPTDGIPHFQIFVELLNRYYTVTLIMGNEHAPTDTPLVRQLSVKNHAWFTLHANRFDHILYQFANAPAYRSSLQLLMLHPGIVMTDDFYADQLYINREEQDVNPLTAMTLYHAQGYSALQTQAAHPCNQQIFGNATGIITHTPSFKEQYQQQYADAPALPVRVIDRLTEMTGQSDIARQYRQTIEAFSQHSPLQAQRRLLNSLADLSGVYKADVTAIKRTADYIAYNFAGWQKPQFLIDVSLLYHDEVKTGIVRVLSSVIQQLLTRPPASYRVEPVYFDGQCYRYARELVLDLLDISYPPALANDPVDVRGHDIFLAMDIHLNRLRHNEDRYRHWRNQGTKFYFIVYDLIHYLRPDVFESQTSREFTAWLAGISQLGNGLICDSKAVATELITWLTGNDIKRESPLNIGYFHLGADIKASFPSTGLPDNASIILDAMRDRPSFIMVSTLEPRKGYAQALAAFTQLWQEDIDVNLIIIGKQGWCVDQLIKDITHHEQLNKRLFWLGYVSDEFLEKLYAKSSALLVTSEAEGFGLPLIEAARHQLPLIVRDIPVFREVANQHAFYFTGKKPEALANALKNWLTLLKKGSIPTSSHMPWLNWQASVDQLLQVICENHWHFTYYPNKIQSMEYDAND